MYEGNVERLDGYKVLARLGKKVLRPGGKQMSLKMLSLLQIGKDDKIVEFAPGLGFTAKLSMAYQPAHYIGVDVDPEVIKNLTAKLGSSTVSFKLGNASVSGLEGSSATKVYGEAMLTMQADHRKKDIIAEAYRVLKPGGLYAIHELALTPDDIKEEKKKKMLVELSKIMKVNARPLTIEEWKAILEDNGFRVLNVEKAPMKFLKINNVIRDEGFIGFLRIIKKVIFEAELRSRLMSMRKLFKHYEKDLEAMVIVAQKQD